MATLFRRASTAWSMAMAVLAMVLMGSLLAQPAAALKFEVAAKHPSEAKKEELCIRHRAAFDQLVIVTAIISGGRANDGEQALGMTVTDVFGNNHGSFKDGFGEKRIVFHARGDGDFLACFQNTLLRGSGPAHRMVEFDVDIGSDAKDWRAIQADQKLKPIEVSLRRAEELLDDIVGDMERLRRREVKLRDTNESTHGRMKWYTFIIIGTMIVLEVGQVMWWRHLTRKAHMN